MKPSFDDALAEIELKILLESWSNLNGDGIRDGMLNPWVFVQWAEGCPKKRYDCDDYLHSHGPADYLKSKGERIVPLFHLAQKVGVEEALRFLREKPEDAPADSFVGFVL